MVASLEITQLEQKAIDAHLVENEEHYEGVTMMTIPRAADNISRHSDPYPTLLWIMIFVGTCAKGKEMVTLQ